MFFPIRCVFWLTIVFTTIFGQDQAGRRAAALEASQTTSGIITALIGDAERLFVGHCTQQPAECLSLAAKLGEMREPPASEPPAKLPQSESEAPARRSIDESVAMSDVPLPPPRPPLPRSDELRLHARPNG